MTREEIASAIKKMRVESGLTQKDIAERLGKKQQTVASWESGQSQPDANTIFVLCDLCGVSINEAFGYQQTEASVTRRELSQIKKYRSLDAYGKDLIDTILDKEVERCAAEPAAPARAQSIRLRRYVSPAAAGAPLYAESEYEEIDFPAEIVPEGTSYALGISGKSMEPDIPDGCTVFVEKTEQIRNGDIVIAWIDGEGTVCKRASVSGDRIIKLESSNRAFADIKGADLDGLRVYGKVLGYTTE